MYAAVRPALGSTRIARPPARFIRRRRYALPHRVLFHSSRCLAQIPNPPATPDNTPVNENDAEKKKRENADGKEKPENSVGSEDPDVLAKKLQRSREQARRYSSALRRSQRRNRAQDLPPIYLPEWFLERRVRIHEDETSQTSRPQRRDCSLSIRSTGSGDRGELSIPFTTYSGSFASIAGIIKAMWRTDMSEEHRKLFAQDFARRIGREGDAELLNVLEKGNEPDVVPADLDPIERERRQAVQREVETCRKYLESHDVPVGEKQSLESEMKAAQDMLQKKEPKRGDGRLSPLLLAEIRATIAASLTALRPTVNDSFPSSKTNLTLYSPIVEHERALREVVFTTAAELGADVVTLEAQDLAQLAGDYLGEGPDPTPNSIRSLGYETYRVGAELAADVEEFEISQETFEDDQDGPQSGFPKFLFPLSSLSGPPSGKMPIRVNVSIPGFNSLKDITSRAKSAQIFSPQVDDNAGTGQVRTNDAHLEDLKLSTLLEALVDSTELKRSRVSPASRTKLEKFSLAPSLDSSRLPKLFDYSFTKAGTELDFTTAIPWPAKDEFNLTLNTQSSDSRPQVAPRPKIIYIKDIKELSATYHGNGILRKLEDIVRKQRHAGESVMLVGTTCSPDFCSEKITPNTVQTIQSEAGDGFSRTIFVAPGAWREEEPHVPYLKALRIGTKMSDAERRKFRTINLRHIQDMLKNLDPSAAAGIADPGQVCQIRQYGPVFPESYFWSVLTYDEVHRISLTALGLHALSPQSSQISWAHVALAMGLLKASDSSKFAFGRSWSEARKASQRQSLGLEGREKSRLSPLRRGRDPSSRPTDPEALRRHENLEHVKVRADSHERKIMHGIVNPDQMKTGFDQVHVPKETIDAIRTLTSMSLLRPDAFNYGVLATEKISGALLYGPPGTGKTLLAKAVAKESGSQMLEVSGSQIMDKYVGEGEKNVAAIFSLARKLSPCIVFLDEADAIFGTRDASRDRTSHRDILNQFLKEWDGLNDSSVFVMVATNRPFDLDDAVIRRLPRRLLVDLPGEADRKSILDIHLRGEQIDEGVDISDLAKRTPFYSGSDLKNVVVFAALNCVREENEQAAIAAAKAALETQREQQEVQIAGQGEREADAETASTSPAPESENPSSASSSPPPLVQGQTYTFPPRRTLCARHFDKALAEISASISEDMSSLSAIKKFDEQYGDRKGRRKKVAYGFGVKPEEKGVDGGRVRG